MIQVVCWKWNAGIHKKKRMLFTHEHVNRLKNMVGRHLHVPHEFICITDDATGIDPSIRIIPLWADHRDMGGCYVRLRAFQKEMGQIIGPRFCWLDLDTVVVNDITPLLTRPEPFVMWGDTAPGTPYNGSMLLMTAGSRSQVWEQFKGEASRHVGRRMRYVGTDQAWIGAVLGPHEPKWTTADGVYSFRVHLQERKIKELPANARIVFFHGSADPSQADVQTLYPWVREHWQ